MFWKEKHTRKFLAELLCIACLGITAALLIIRVQENRMRELLFEHDEAVAASLLEQGVSKQAVAEAVGCAWRGDADFAPADEEKILGQIGLSEETDIRFLPAVEEYCAAERMAIFLGGAIFFMLLFRSIYRYLQKRDSIYRNAITVVEKYADNDFSLSLPELYDGTLYQLFSRINFMASVLKTGQEAENKVKEFLKTTVSDISHQLKTPLAALSMYQEIILHEPDHAETVTAFARKSETALTRMEGLIQSLLKITRLDSGNIIFSKKEFEASELALQAVEDLADRAGKEEKELVLLGDKDARVDCDMEWSREALGNVVKNALDHTGKGDRVVILWEQTPLTTRFTVTDTGEGIAEEDIYHIFKRFYKSGNTGKGQGAGLGLPLAKAIVEGQGGTVSVQSERGKGTEFVLSFPVKR